MQTEGEYPSQFHLEPLQHDPVLRSFCKHPPAIKSADRMKAWNLEGARRRAHGTKEARLTHQQALAARARASQTTEACAWAHRLSLRGLQQVSVNQGQVTAEKEIHEGSTCSAGARVTDDGSLCLGISRFGVSSSASHCELRRWKDPNSRPWATLCDNLCRSMEARGDQKIHTFYCRRLTDRPNDLTDL